MDEKIGERFNVKNTISFLPPEELLPRWRDDYNNMIQSFIYGNALAFDTLMERMRELQRRVRGD